MFVRHYKHKPLVCSEKKLCWHKFDFESEDQHYKLERLYAYKGSNQQ